MEIKIASNGTLMKRLDNGMYTFLPVPSSKISFCGIYGIYDKLYDKWYIGSSIDLVGRIEQHKGLFKRTDKYKDVKLMYFLHPCHQNNIEYHILERCKPVELPELERYYIRIANSLEPSGYNCNLLTKLKR